MIVGMIFAMQEELDAFLKLHESPKSHQHKHLKIVEITVNSHTCYCITSGIGKVNAAYATSLLVHLYKVNVILNSGVAGGVHTDVGTLIISRGVMHHDVDVTTFKYEHGQIPGFKTIFDSDTALTQHAQSIAEQHNWPHQIGIIASGDQFVTQLKTIEKSLSAHTDIHAVEMEAAAIAQIARLEGIPFLIIRAISDVIGGSSQAEDFTTFLSKSSQKAAVLLDALLKKL